MKAQVLTTQPTDSQNYIYFAAGFDGGWYRLAALSKKQFKALLQNSKHIVYGGFSVDAKYVKKHFKKLVKVVKFFEQKNDEYEEPKKPSLDT